MLLDQVKTRIEDAAGKPFVSVDTAIRLAAALDNPPQRVPAAWVYPSAAQGGPVGGANAHRQAITTRFGVVFFLRSDSDPTGGRKTADVETIYTWLRAQLIGWVPDPVTGAAVAYERGYLTGFEGGGVWWAEEFAIEHLHRLT